MASHGRVSDGDYARLLALRTRLRAFEQWSADQAASCGLTTSQHQLLLAVRGHGDDRGPTIAQVAEYLSVRHNTAGGLVDRTEALGLVRRVRDDGDRRIVRLVLTDEGAERIAELSDAHLQELAQLGPMFDGLVDRQTGAG